MHKTRELFCKRDLTIEGNLVQKNSSSKECFCTRVPSTVRSRLQRAPIIVRFLLPKSSLNCKVSVAKELP